MFGHGSKYISGTGNFSCVYDIVSDAGSWSFRNMLMETSGTFAHCFCCSAPARSWTYYAAKTKMEDEVGVLNSDSGIWSVDAFVPLKSTRMGTFWSNVTAKMARFLQRVRSTD